MRLKRQTSSVHIVDFIQIIECLYLKNVFYNFDWSKEQTTTIWDSPNLSSSHAVISHDFDEVEWFWWLSFPLPLLPTRWPVWDFVQPARECGVFLPTLQPVPAQPLEGAAPHGAESRGREGAGLPAHLHSHPAPHHLLTGGRYQAVQCFLSQDVKWDQMRKLKIAAGFNTYHDLSSFDVAVLKK